MSQRNQQIQQINQTIESEQRDPNAQISLDSLNDQVVRATDHVNMCYGG